MSAYRHLSDDEAVEVLAGDEIRSDATSWSDSQKPKSSLETWKVPPNAARTGAPVGARLLLLRTGWRRHACRGIQAATQRSRSPAAHLACRSCTT